VRYYAYGGNGTRVMVHPDDVAKRPDLFEVVAVTPVVEPEEVVEQEESISLTGPIETPTEPEIAEPIEVIEPAQITDLTLVSGVGPARAKKMEEAGIQTVNALAQMEENALADLIGISLSVAAALIESAKGLVEG
jgi:predicted flap endonuclease-1-like 5' DNA nuclease